MKQLMMILAALGFMALGIWLFKQIVTTSDVIGKRPNKQKQVAMEEVKKVPTIEENTSSRKHLRRKVDH